MSLTWAALIFRGEKVSEHHSGNNATLINSSDQRHSLLVYFKQFINVKITIIKYSSNAIYGF